MKTGVAIWLSNKIGLNKKLYRVKDDNNRVEDITLIAKGHATTKPQKYDATKDRKKWGVN